jgi:glycosyltransferase involved in cell wall biosynthesis
MSDAQGRYEGSLDEVSAKHVVGWVRDTQSTGALIKVEVLVDGVVIGAVQANPRPNDAAGNSARCVFRLPMPAAFRDARTHGIEVRIAGTDILLTPPSSVFNLAWFGPDIAPRAQETDFLRQRASRALSESEQSTVRDYPYASLSESVGKPGAPVVVVGDANHIGPRFLARYWADRGVPVVLISKDEAAELGDNVKVVHAAKFEPAFHRRIRPRLQRWLLKLERAAQRYSKWRGNADENPYAWLPFVTDSLVSAVPLVQAIKATKPLFVFGHEVSAYGLATVLCRGCPRIVFPWGADVVSYPDASPLLGLMTKVILKSADLVVPSSDTANSYISKRFGVKKDKAAGISWGIDRKTFRKASSEEKAEICVRWRIDPNHLIVLNSRRFREAWGSHIALQAFIRLAQAQDNIHCVLLGGDDTEADIQAAWTNIVQLGLSDRFTLIAGPAPIETCTDLMSVADIFTSFLGLGDMRSWSVLQATACGGVPVVADIPEHRKMEGLGFRGVFVPLDDVQAAYEALLECVKNPEQRDEIVSANDRYMELHEDEESQMTMFWQLMSAECERFAGLQPRHDCLKQGQADAPPSS